MGELPRLLKEMRALVTERGVYRVEEVHRRPLGDLDVIVSYSSPGVDKRFAGYRSDGDGWRRLNAAWRDLPEARREIGTVIGCAPLADRNMTKLLDLAREIAG